MSQQPQPFIKSTFTLDQIRPDRFWSKVNKDGKVVRPELGACWEWIGDTHEHGYGRYTPGARFKQQFTHRISWEMSNGIITDPLLCVLHMCDNPPCCNPSHLFLGTRPENTADMVRKERQSRGVTRKTKLNEMAVLVIRQVAREGKSHGRIAAAYRVSRECVRDIVNCKKWRYLCQS